MQQAIAPRLCPFGILAVPLAQQGIEVVVWHGTRALRIITSIIVGAHTY
jgi:hypothetical protein